MPQRVKDLAPVVPIFAVGLLLIFGASRCKLPVTAADVANAVRQERAMCPDSVPNLEQTAELLLRDSGMPNPDRLQWSGPDRHQSRTNDRFACEVMYARSSQTSVFQTVAVEFYLSEESALWGFRRSSYDDLSEATGYVETALGEARYTEDCIVVRANWSREIQDSHPTPSVRQLFLRESFSSLSDLC